MKKTLDPSTTARWATFWHRASLTSFGALMILFSVWYLWIQPPAHPWTILLIHIIPLSLFLPGMLKKKPRPYIWLCFVILLYFCQGAISLFALPQPLGIFGILDVFLTITLFCCAMMAARYLARMEMMVSLSDDQTEQSKLH